MADEPEVKQRPDGLKSTDLLDMALQDMFTSDAPLGDFAKDLYNSPAFREKLELEAERLSQSAAKQDATGASAMKAEAVRNICQLIIATAPAEQFKALQKYFIEENGSEGDRRRSVTSPKVNIAPDACFICNKPVDSMLRGNRDRVREQIQDETRLQEQVDREKRLREQLLGRGRAERPVHEECLVRAKEIFNNLDKKGAQGLGGSINDIEKLVGNTDLMRTAQKLYDDTEKLMSKMSKKELEILRAEIEEEEAARAQADAAGASGSPPSPPQLYDGSSSTSTTTTTTTTSTSTSSSTSTSTSTSPGGAEATQKKSFVRSVLLPGVAVTTAAVVLAPVSLGAAAGVLGAGVIAGAAKLYKDNKNRHKRWKAELLGKNKEKLKQSQMGWPNITLGPGIRAIIDEIRPKEKVNLPGPLPHPFIACTNVSWIECLRILGGMSAPKVLKLHTHSHRETCDCQNVLWKSAPLLGDRFMYRLQGELINIFRRHDVAFVDYWGNRTPIADWLPQCDVRPVTGQGGFTQLFPEFKTFGEHQDRNSGLFGYDGGRNSVKASRAIVASTAAMGFTTWLFQVRDRHWDNIGLFPCIDQLCVAAIDFEVLCGTRMWLDYESLALPWCLVSAIENGGYVSDASSLAKVMHECHVAVSKELDRLTVFGILEADRTGRPDLQAFFLSSEWYERLRKPWSVEMWEYRLKRGAVKKLLYDAKYGLQQAVLRK